MILTFINLECICFTSVDDSSTLTAIEACPNDESESGIQGPEEVAVTIPTDVLPEMGPVTFEEHKKMLKKMVQKDFLELQKCKSTSIKYQGMFEGA